MSMGDNIIIVKKKKGGHGGHHGGAWKVAFADFMTAMMCFFLVMWLITQKAGTREAIAAYFRDPGVFETTKGALLSGGPGALDGTAIAAAPDMSLEMARQALARAGERIKEELARTGGLDQLGKQVEIQMTAEGLRIELVDTEESMFFDSGSAHVKPQTERMLGLIARELGTLGRAVILEGHTDSRPYAGGRLYTNWDLSTDRANAARRVMEAAGLAGRQVAAVRGYADRHLRVSGQPLSARTRRVSIVVPLDVSRQ